MVKKKKRDKLFWIVLAIALVLLVVLYGFVIRKRFIVERGLIGVVSDENSAAGANSEAVSEVINGAGVVDDVNKGLSGGSSGGGGSGGGSGSSGNDGSDDAVLPPPVIPEVVE